MKGDTIPLARGMLMSSPAQLVLPGGGEEKFTIGRGGDQEEGCATQRLLVTEADQSRRRHPRNALLPEPQEEEEINPINGQ